MSLGKTGFLYSDRFLEHDTGKRHPENARRLSHTLEKIQESPWQDLLTRVDPREAALTWIEEIHTPSYIARVKHSCERGRSHLDTPDVSISKLSYEIALLAAGGCLELCDRLMTKELTNAFALLRPPGHHAEKDLAMGFCLFNNAAIAARYLQKRHRLERVLILDWDVHHGNGTQHLFESDPSVFYVSLHQYPFYPGTGSSWETGVGAGAGTTLNCAMKAGAGDAEYLEAFRTRIDPAVRAFKPDAIIVSAGFDAHRKDPLGQICLESSSFGWMTRAVMDWAAHYSEGKVLSLLEGGYDLDALAESVQRHLEELLNVPSGKAILPKS